MRHVKKEEDPGADEDQEPSAEKNPHGPPASPIHDYRPRGICCFHAHPPNRINPLARVGHLRIAGSAAMRLRRLNDGNRELLRQP